MPPDVSTVVDTSDLTSEETLIFNYFCDATIAQVKKLLMCQPWLTHLVYYQWSREEVRNDQNLELMKKREMWVEPVEISVFSARHSSTNSKS